jgi:hypothetical protein
VQANHVKDIEETRAGDICAFVSMKDTETGDSLTDTDHPALLERMRFPDPVISVSVEPKTRDDVDKMTTALYKMARADPSLRLQVDQETGQTVLRGMGELHLEITIDRMRSELGVEANMGKPKVSFREAFGASVDRIYTHKKQTGGSGQFAEVKMVFEPLPPGSGVEFSDEITGGRIPREFIPSVEHAIRTESKQGQIAGYEVVDFKARLIDGKFHDVDSSALAFEIAGRYCFRESHKASKPKLLEPIMKVEVVTESSYLGDVIGDINRRRGQITDQGQRGPQAFIQGFVPLAEMFGYINFLRSRPAAAATTQWSSTTTHRCRPAWWTSCWRKRPGRFGAASPGPAGAPVPVGPLGPLGRLGPSGRWARWGSMGRERAGGDGRVAGSAAEEECGLEVPPPPVAPASGARRQHRARSLREPDRAPLRGSPPVRSMLCSFVQPEEPDTKGPEVRRLVALQGHACRRLQAGRDKLLPRLDVGIGGVAHDHAGRLETLGGDALEAPPLQ